MDSRLTVDTAAAAADRVANVLVFGALGVAALSRLFTMGLTPPAAGHVLALLAIAAVGHQCASSVVRRSRLPGVAAFLVGWFWLPGVALGALCVWWWTQRPPQPQESQPTEAPRALGRFAAAQRASRPKRSDTARALDFLLFGALALAGSSRLVLWEVTGWTIANVLGLVAISVLGYGQASHGWRWRAGGVLAFAVGWSWQPAAGLVGLWLLGRRRPPQVVSITSGIDPSASELRRACFALETALAAPGRIRGFQLPFTSPIGEGRIPLLMVTEQGESGFYFETESWNDESTHRFLEWMSRLRSSERAALRVEVRATSTVPDEILRRCHVDPAVATTRTEQAAPRPGPTIG
jgi:hypothetical protein